MIIRQFCARHGRSAVDKSARAITSRLSAHEIDIPPPARSALSRRLSNTSGSLLDTLSPVDTLRISELERDINSAAARTAALREKIYTYTSGHLFSAFSEDTPEPIPTEPESEIAPRFHSIAAYNKYLHDQREMSRLGSSIVASRSKASLRLLLENPLAASDLTLPLLLAAQTHLGHATSLWNPRNSSSIFGIRDGIHIISLETTLSALRRAAKVVSAVAARGGLILFVGTRPGQTEIVVKAAKLAGGYHVFERWTPGSLTNGQQILGHCKLKVVDMLDRDRQEYTEPLQAAASDSGHGHPVLRPSLVVCLNPLENEVLLHECGLYTVPTIGIIDTNADPSWVTYSIPANDDSLRSVAMIAGVLGRAGEEGQKIRMEAAQHGRATYSTREAEQFLKGLKEIRSMDVQVNDAEEGGRRTQARA